MNCNFIDGARRLSPRKRPAVDEFDDYFDIYHCHHDNHSKEHLIREADVIERPDCFEVLIDLPGVTAEEIHVQFTSGRLMEVRTHRQYVHNERQDVVHQLQRPYGTIRSRVLLPINAEEEKAVFSFKRGVLTISLPKKSTTRSPATVAAGKQRRTRTRTHFSAGLLRSMLS